MTFTYTNDPANSERDAVRVLLQDTTETGHKLSDETIAWLLAENPNVWYAAADGADIIVSEFTSSVTEKQVGDLRLKTGSGDPASQYRGLAASLRRQAATKGFTAFSGGISISDKDTELEDSDRPADEAAIGQHDNYPTGSSTSATSWWP